MMEMETVTKNMKYLQNNELSTTYGGADPCHYSPPAGAGPIDRVDYFIGFVFTKLRISVTG